VISCSEGVPMVKKFVHLKKNVMMIDTTFASCTQEKREGSKITGGKHKKTKCKRKLGTKAEKCIVMAK
jgi:hypothetical protein